MKFSKDTFKKLFLFLILYSGSYFSFSQSYIFKNYSASEGLPHSKVNSILQTPDGYIWVGTDGGLSRFDGINFKNYSTSDSLAESNAGAMALDTKGNIWVGHNAGGISRFNGKAFEKITLPESVKPKRIFSIFIDTKENIWLATQDEGAIRISFSEASTAKPVKVQVYKKQEGLWDVVTQIYEDKQGVLWFVTDGGVKTFSEKEKKFTLFTHDKMTNYPVTSLTEMKNGDFLFGTYQGGIALWQRASNKIDFLNHDTGLPSNDIFTLLNDKAGEVWIGTWGAGAVKLSDNHLEQFTRKEGLAGNKIRCIFQDRENNFWIGTNEDGLSCFKGKKFSLFSKNEGLPNNLVNGVTQDTKGNYWVATQDGLSILQLNKAGKVQNQKSISLKDKLGNNDIRAIAKDKHGNIIAGTNGGGAIILNPLNGALVKAFTSFSANYVNSILCDDKGVIWFGTVAGITCYDEKNNSYKNYGTHNGLGGTDIVCLYQDSKKNIWIAARNGGLTLYQQESGTFKIFSGAEGFSHISPISISESSDGIIWIGTEGGGVYSYDGKQFKQFGIKDGLPSEFITFVLCKKDLIWIGTNKGITKWNQKQNVLRTFNVYDGLPGNETRTNSVFYSEKENELFFGTSSGMVRYSPEFDKPNREEVNTHITKFRIFLDEANMSSDTVLNFKQHDVSFDYIGLSFSAEENVKYMYKLEGLDENWRPATSQTTASYTNLSFGDYAFLVKAANADGVWNTEPVKFSFTITPPWYLTKIAFVCYVLLITGGPVLFVKWRTRKLLQDKEILEQQVKERTIEIAAKNITLASANKEIAAKNKDITDSIEYAKRIQSAILPFAGEIENSLPESFVIFKPRDIVSGDFYWFANCEKDGRTVQVIVSADCTGHGVPGAFLTMIGNNTLNQIVIENRITSPSKILVELNNHIKFALKQAGEGGETRDGMDIALCRIDKEKKELVFASANRPIYLFKGTKLEILLADKTAIGGFTAENYNFSEQTISYADTVSFYMFTDGYADQFGGLDGKKFMTKKLKDLLISIQDKSMSEQKIILSETIDSWKEGHEQVDDITAVGVRI